MNAIESMEASFVPPSPHKIERLEARVSTEQKSLFQHAAHLLGASLTDFVLSSLQQAAKQVIQDHQIVRLSMQDSHQFVRALLKPPKPNAALKKAVKRYQKLVG